MPINFKFPFILVAQKHILTNPKVVVQKHILTNPLTKVVVPVSLQLTSRLLTFLPKLSLVNLCSGLGYIL